MPAEGPPHVAVSDCERVRPGLIAQPVNTVSSLTYCAAGVWVLRKPVTARRAALGFAAIAAGIGSVAYHGPGGRTAKVIHDIGATALVAMTALSSLTGPVTARQRLVTLGCVGAGIVVHGTSRTGRALCRPDSILQGHALWHALGAAAVLTVAGTTDAATAGRGVR